METEKIIEIYEKALREIIETQGKVCSMFEVCGHESCRSSVTSWFIADKALKTVEGSDLYKGE